MTSASYICPNCGTLDTGTYCSQCGATLIVPRNQLDIILSKRLETAGFAPIQKTSLPPLLTSDFKDVVTQLMTVSERLFFSDDSLPGSPTNISFVALIEHGALTDVNLKALRDVYERCYGFSLHRTTIKSAINLVIIVICDQASRQQLRSIKRFRKNAAKSSS